MIFFIKSILFSISLSFVISLNAKPIDSNILFASPDNSIVKLSPDGTYVSYYYRDKKNHSINLIDLSTNEQITSIPIGYDNKLISYQWINNSQLYLNFSYPKGEASFVGNLKDGKIKLNLVKAKGYLVSVLPNQPNKVMFARKTSGSSNYYDLYIVDPNVLLKDNFNRNDRIKHDSSKISNYFYDLHSERIITNEYNEDSKDITLKYISINGGNWSTILKLKDTEYKLEPQGFITENKLAVLTNKNSDKMLLQEFDVKKQELGKIIYQHHKYDLKSASFTSKGQLDFVTYLQHGLVKTDYFDKGKSSFIQRLANTFSNQEAYIIDYNQNRNRSLLYVNGSNQPGEYFIYDHLSDKLNRLLVAHYDLQETTFHPSQHTTITTKDKTEIETFLTLPMDLDHSTLLIMPHGGPIDVQESDRFNQEVQYYASRGFAVLRVNFRGSAGFGKSFTQQGVGEFGQLIEEDITAAVEQITKKHQFKYMCSIGASYGGYSAVMLAIKHPSQYDCVIAAYGVYDLPLLFNTSNLRSGKEYQELIAKTVGEFDTNMVNLSPVYLNEKLKAPLLLIAGQNDDISGFEQSNRFNYVLKRNKHSVETIFYKNTAHGHNNWIGDRHEAAATYDFLVRTLNLPMSDPKKLDNESKSSIAEDYAYIADAYEQIKEDKEKSIDYYLKAANYDHPRANFNVGSYYHSGTVVELDLKKAIEFYSKSAELGFDKAHARLGRMYMEGEYLEKNWQKAFDHLTKAQTLDDSPFNNIRLARFLCIAPDEFKNINRCLELMDLEQYKKRTKSITEKAIIQIRESLAWIIAEANLSKLEIIEIQKFAQTIFSLNEFKVSLDNIREGQFTFIESERFGKNGEYELSNPGFNIKATDNKTDRFGLIFEVDIPGTDSYTDQVALAARWIKTTSDGMQRYFNSIILYGDPTGDWKMLHSFDDVKENATWTLEIFDFNQNIIYKNDFYLKALDNKKVILDV